MTLRFLIHSLRSGMNMNVIIPKQIKNWQKKIREANLQDKVLKLKLNAIPLDNKSSIPILTNIFKDPISDDLITLFICLI
jgi:hypothetical protein